MTAITKGHELMREIADMLEANPKLHVQSSWQNVENECGATACIAGWACILGTNDFFVRGKHYIPRKPVVDRILEANQDRWGLSILEKEYLEDPSNPQRRVDVLDLNGYYRRKGGALFGLHEDSTWDLFDGDYGPIDGHDVPSALRHIADGGDIEDVWGLPD